MGKKLSISILVSGREDTTEKCLESIKPLLEAVDSELILVDTGCGSELKELLKKYTDRVISFVWCNDFAKARNAGLAEAFGEWFMFLDDDEWFEDVTPLIEFFRSEESKNYDQAVYLVRNYHDLQRSSYSDAWLSRIIRREADTHFEGKVHEMLIPAKGKCKKIHAFAHHYGYAGHTKEVLQKKYERNVPLLLEMIKEQPNNMRWRLQLLQEYHSVELGEEMRKAAKNAMDVIDGICDTFVNQCRGVYQTAESIGHILDKQYEAAMAKVSEYLRTNEKDAYIACSLAMQGLIAASEAEQYGDVLKFFKIYWENLSAWRDEEKTEQQQIIEETLFFVKDAVTKHNIQSALRRYAVACIRIQRLDAISVECKQELEGMMYSYLENRGDFLLLPADVWEIAEAELVDFETQILSLDMAQWLALGGVLEKQTMDVFVNVEKHLAKIRKRDDIRYRYLNMKYHKALIMLQGEQESYQALYQRFYDFTVAELNYYTCIFKDAAFSGQGEMLPPDARAALWLEKFFTSEENDWETKFYALRMCAKVYPALGENIKSFAQRLGDEQKALSPANELSQLVSAMKDKVRVMIEQGMAVEALQTIVQLKQFACDDVELLELETMVRQM